MANSSTIPPCRYIHGKPQMMTAEQVVKMGYTPDPRCMRKAFQKKFLFDLTITEL